MPTPTSDTPPRFDARDAATVDHARFDARSDRLRALPRSRRWFLLTGLAALAGCSAPAPAVPTAAPTTAPSPTPPTVPTSPPAPTATVPPVEPSRTPIPSPSPPAASPSPAPGGPAVSPSPGASPSPSPIVMASPADPTAVPTAPVLARASPAAIASPGPTRLFADDFRDAKSGFPTGRSSDGVAEHGYDPTLGEYRIAFSRAPGANADASFWDAVVDIYDTFDDFRLELEARQSGASVNGAWGVIFRVQDFANFYKVSVDPNSGQYEFYKLVADRRTDFIPWRPTAAIHRASQSNHLTVIARGNQLTVRLNDINVATTTDDTFKRGRVGMIANVWADPLEFRFRNLSIWTP